MGAALGISPFKSPVELYLEKTGRKVREDEPTEAMLFGIENEDYAARRYAAKTGRAVRNYGYMLFDDDAHLCADVDRLVVPDGAKVASFRDEIRTDRILECKVVGHPWDDGVPATYQAQALVYLALAFAQFCDVSVVFRAPRVDHQIFPLERDEGKICAIRERAKEWFERHVLGDTPPPAVNEDDCKALWAASRGVAVDATPEAADAIRLLRETVAQIKSLEAHASELRAVAMRALGEGDTLVDPETGLKLCTWKSSKDSEVVDWKSAFYEMARTEEPAHVARILAEHTERKPGARRFLLPPVKG